MSRDGVPVGPDNPPLTLEEYKAAALSQRSGRGRLAVMLHNERFKQTPDHQGEVVKREDFTCNRCVHEPYCPSAWDFYNTDGDCLESK